MSRKFNLKKIFFLGFVILFLILLFAFILILNPRGRSTLKEREKSVFAKFTPNLSGLPELEIFKARDFDRLSYRHYFSESNNVVILLHGSSAQGEYLNQLARYLSENNIAKVYVPNLRGHYLSGRHRGDCEYIGQIEDDIVDLINKFAKDNKNIFLIGHSLGGGLAIRFAGSNYNDLINGYILLTPAIPNTPVLKNNNAGGWSSVYRLRNYGLMIFNLFGIKGLNSLPIIEFNKPGDVWNGKETLTYSYRLAHSLMPRIVNLKKDLDGLKNKFILLVGSDDEACDAAKYSQVIKDSAESIKILQNVNHRDIIQDKNMFDIVGKWILNRIKN